MKRNEKLSGRVTPCVEVKQWEWAETIRFGSGAGCKRNILI
jgi:hypothetical protein